MQAQIENRCSNGSFVQCGDREVLLVSAAVSPHTDQARILHIFADPGKRVPESTTIERPRDPSIDPLSDLACQLPLDSKTIQPSKLSLGQTFAQGLLATWLAISPPITSNPENSTKTNTCTDHPCTYVGEPCNVVNGPDAGKRYVCHHSFSAGKLVWGYTGRDNPKPKTQPTPISPSGAPDCSNGIATCMTRCLATGYKRIPCAVWCNPCYGASIPQQPSVTDRALTAVTHYFPQLSRNESEICSA